MNSGNWVPFEIAVRSGDGAVVLDVSGEFDLSEVETFQACVDGAMVSAAGALVVDLREVTFIDSSAISALLAARRRLADQHRELRLQHTASVRRIFELAGLAELLDDSTEPTTHRSGII